MRIKIISMILFIHFFYSFSQENALKKANRSYDNFAYADAIREYEDIIQKGNGTLEVYQKLGDSYYFNLNQEGAVKWYEKMIASNEELPVKYYFRAAQSFKYFKRYEDAHELMHALKKINKDDPGVNRFLDTPDYLAAIAKQSGRYKIKNLPINTGNTDFAPSFYKDQLVFSSSRERGSSFNDKSKWAEQPYLKIYSSTIEKTGEIKHCSEFSKRLDTKFHESTTTFTKYGTVIYFTTINILRLKSQKDPARINGLKILRGYLNYKNEWVDIEELPFNSEDYSIAHPALSPDNKKLYFVSDMPGGYGMSDIYEVDILENDGFGEPRNLGPEINTEGRDTFPFISNKGNLYFASDGHLGLGGLDIFVTKLKGKRKKVYNLGEPINSPADDMTFIINDYSKKGYFASNRSGGKGGDDIYSLEELRRIVPDCVGVIKGTVVDEDSNSVLADVHIELKDTIGEILYKGKTDDKGAFLLQIDCDYNVYEIAVKKDRFDPLYKRIFVTKENPNLLKTFKLSNQIPALKGTDIAKFLKLKSIYFKSSKSILLENTILELDKVVYYLQKHPMIKIEIRSHTDSRGNDASNLKLSIKRSKAIANYIINKGIDSSRIENKGYGETVLVNECSSGVKCTKEQHQQNRRSEFIVMKG